MTAVYRSQQIDLLNFFKCTNSPESISDLEKHVQTMQHHEQDYGRALSNIATLKREVIESMSHFSGSSLKQTFKQGYFRHCVKMRES